MKSNKIKKGQITIFIIIALIIVTFVALLFVLINKPDQQIFAEQNPQEVISSCLTTSLAETEKRILEGNGYLNITDNYILFSLNKPSEKVPYLCKSSQFYMPCINQEPMFVEFVRKQIQEKEKIEAEICFKNLVNNFKRAGYQVQEGNLNLEVRFETKTIILELNKKITITKNEQTKTYEKFNSQIQSPLFRLIDTARIIVNYESTLCEFNTLNWMKYYRDISIKRFVTGTATKIYTLTDIVSDKKINFAVRTCALPAGI